MVFVTSLHFYGRVGFYKAVKVPVVQSAKNLKSVTILF